MDKFTVNFESWSPGGNPELEQKIEEILTKNADEINQLMHQVVVEYVKNKLNNSGR